MGRQRVALLAYYKDLFWYTIQKYLFECHPLRQVEEILFKLATNGRSDEAFLLT